MIAILWAILNISFFIFFLYLCIRAIAMVRRNMGLGIAIVFVIGLFSITGNRAGPDHNEQKTWKFNDTLAPVRSTSWVTIDRNPVFSISIVCSYGYDKATGKSLPVSAFSSFAGLHSGVKWKPTNILIFPDDSSDSKLKYEVSGTFEWQLLNATIRYEYRNYSGVIDLSQ